MGEENKGNGDKLVFELGDMHDGCKDWVYLQIPKKQIPQFVKDLLDGSAKCLADKTATGYHALLPGVMFAVHPELEARIQEVIDEHKSRGG